MEPEHHSNAFRLLPPEQVHKAVKLNDNPEFIMWQSCKMTTHKQE